jgi:hypothetical protein
MGNPAYRNDYTAREVYEAHLKEAAARHDQLRYQCVGIKNVPCDSSFDAFADMVAYSIRGTVMGACAIHSSGARYGARDGVSFGTRF